jgi:hypothetical protein
MDNPYGPAPTMATSKAEFMPTPQSMAKFLLYPDWEFLSPAALRRIQSAILELFAAV